MAFSHRYAPPTARLRRHRGWAPPRPVVLLGVAASLASACTRGPARAPAPPASRSDAWSYRVGVDRDATQLEVQGAFAPGWADSLTVDGEATPFVEDVRYDDAGRWLPARRQGEVWTVPCRSHGCTVRYRFALAEAARQLDDVDTAVAAGDVYVAPPSTWLLRPTGSWPAVAAQTRFVFRVVMSAGWGFATGIRPVPDEGAGVYGAATSEMDGASYAAFGPFEIETIHGGAWDVDVVAAPRGLSLGRAQVVDWIRSAVLGVAAYYRQKLSVERALVIVVPGKQGSTRGKTLADGGPAVLVRVGTEVTPATVRDDWVVVHELLHATLPSLAALAPEHSWLPEGIATYVEPIVRARSGVVGVERFWRDLVEGLPQGLPQAGDQGLERTPTWGRTYWGGAMFCLIADVRIREQTRGTRSFDDALRTLSATNEESQGDVARLLARGDASTGTGALARTYEEMGLAPGAVDLPDLWRRLGVNVSKDRVSFDDSAPLAWVRRAITSP